MKQNLSLLQSRALKVQTKFTHDHSLFNRSLNEETISEDSSSSSSFQDLRLALEFLPQDYISNRNGSNNESKEVTLFLATSTFENE